GDARPLTLEGTTARPFTSNRGAAKFDLLFSFREHADGLRIMLEYRRDLFFATTIDRMLGHLGTLLAAAVAAPETRVDALPLLTPPERQQLLVEWNDTEATWPVDATLHGLFEQQVAQRPSSVAVQSG